MAREFRIHSEKSGAIRGYIPDGYDGRFTIVYAHGYGDTVDSSWTKHKLPEQFRASGLKALFISVESPANASQNVLNPDLPTILHTVATEAGIVPPRKVVAIGHSGAYRTLSRWIDYDNLKQIILLDGLFGGQLSFTKFVGRGGRLTNVATDRTATNSDALAKKIKVDYTRVNDDHMAIVTSGRYLPALLKRSEAAGGVPVGFFLLSAAVLLLFLR